MVVLIFVSTLFIDNSVLKQFSTVFTQFFIQFEITKVNKRTVGDFKKNP